MTVASILAQVQEYYDDKLQTHGATPRGVDWNSSESQELRFAQLVRLIDAERAFSVNDYGCGYGALADYLERGTYQFQYIGFDVSTKMIAKARELHARANHLRFISDREQ